MKQVEKKAITARNQSKDEYRTNAWYNRRKRSQHFHIFFIFLRRMNSQSLSLTAHPRDPTWRSCPTASNSTACTASSHSSSLASASYSVSRQPDPDHGLVLAHRTTVPPTASRHHPIPKINTCTPNPGTKRKKHTFPLDSTLPNTPLPLPVAPFLNTRFITLLHSFSVLWPFNPGCA